MIALHHCVISAIQHELAVCHIFLPSSTALPTHLIPPSIPPL